MTASTTTVLRDDKGHVARILFGKPVRVKECQRAAAVASLNESFDEHEHLQELIREKYSKRD